MEKKGKKELVFEALKKGHKKERIMREFGISQNSFYNYRAMFKKAKQQEKVEQMVEQKIADIAEETNIEGIKDIINKEISGEKINSYVTVDLHLKDGTIIKDASIFDNNVEKGDKALESIVEIENIINNTKSSFWNSVINFQTSNILGSVHPNNVEKYKINIIEAN